MEECSGKANGRESRPRVGAKFYRVEAGGIGCFVYVCKSAGKEIISQKYAFFALSSRMTFDSNDLVSALPRATAPKSKLQVSVVTYLAFSRKMETEMDADADADAAQDGNVNNALLSRTNKIIVNERDNEI